MTAYIIRRILLMIPVLMGASLIVFSLIRLVPGDVVLQQIGGAGHVSKDEMEKIRHQLGIDRPFHEQYATWALNAVRGDLGKSLWSGKPVMQELIDRTPVTLELAFLSIFIAVIIAIPIGVISATRQNTPADYIGRLIAITGLSLPDFWMATIAVVFLGLYFKYLPPLGYHSPLEDLGKNLQQFLLPAAIEGFRLSAITMRMTRSTMLEVLRQDYIRTAWSKGLRERGVIYRHAMKNALIPVVTIIGTQLSRQLGGQVIIESIFSLPGVGRLTLDSIVNRDYTQLQGNVMFIAVIVVVANLLVDISYAWLDPRIRYS